MDSSAAKQIETANAYMHWRCVTCFANKRAASMLGAPASIDMLDVWLDVNGRIQRYLSRINNCGLTLHVTIFWGFACLSYSMAAASNAEQWRRGSSHYKTVQKSGPAGAFTANRLKTQGHTQLRQVLEWVIFRQLIPTVAHLPAPFDGKNFIRHKCETKTTAGNEGSEARLALFRTNNSLMILRKCSWPHLNIFDERLLNIITPSKQYNTS